MNPFLEEVAEYMLTHHDHEAGGLCLVTPNRRAALFFRKHYGRKLKRVAWAPDTLSIEDFINRISGLTVTDSTSLLFHFYEIYCKAEQEKAKPFDEFMRWAPVLLTDMDEIDAHLEEPGQIYNALKDIRRIETWNPDGSPLTEFQRTYLAFFDRLEVWHRELTSHLLERGIAGQGLSSRQASQQVAHEDFSLPWQKVYFVGFNALNPCEEKIILKLLKRGQAEFLADGDQYYAGDPGHEAGMFLRQSAKRLGLERQQFGEHFKSGQKRIHLLGIAKNVNQARLAGNILLQRPAISRNEQTAIVLANEKLLVPVLNALPDGIDKVNVTMGYPLNKTNMYGFFDALWRLLQPLATKGNHQGAGAKRFYHKDLTRFFSHSYAGLIWENGPVDGSASGTLRENGPGDGSAAGTLRENGPGDGSAAGLVHALRSANRSFFSFDELAELSNDPERFRSIFSFLSASDSGDMMQLTGSMLSLVMDFDRMFREKAAREGGSIVNTQYFIDFEALYFLGALLRRMSGFMKAYPYLNDFHTARNLFRQLADATRLSFSGEPLEGLQVMGMLETRNLDFRNVILLSANENIIPRAKNNQSFIPFDLRKRFGLPVHNDKDAVYAYHFYRLLQRAENIFLVYNTQTEDIGSSEKSRFLTQLQMELALDAPNILISEQVVSLPPPQPPAGHEEVIEKTPDIMTRLLGICKAGVSPSALNSYISCPFHFYLTRVAGIEEAEEVEETIEATTMGTVVHAVLETLYRPFIGKSAGRSDYDMMLKQIDHLTLKQFEENYPGGDISSGKNLLLFTLVKRYVENFLRAERQATETATAGKMEVPHVKGLEQRLSAVLETEVNGETIPVRIRGMADRIDETGSLVRIIDYKTGKLRNNELKFNEWELIGKDGRYGKVFQLLTYAWLYSREHGTGKVIEPGIISMREVKKGLQTLRHPDGDGLLTTAHIDMFEARLGETLREILDPDIPIERTSETENCKYCPFRTFCRRF